MFVIKEVIRYILPPHRLMIFNRPRIEPAAVLEPYFLVVLRGKHQLFRLSAKFSVGRKKGEKRFEFAMFVGIGQGPFLSSFDVGGWCGKEIWPDNEKNPEKQNFASGWSQNDLLKHAEKCPCLVDIQDYFVNQKERECINVKILPCSWTRSVGPHFKARLEEVARPLDGMPCIATCRDETLGLLYIPTQWDFFWWYVPKTFSCNGLHVHMGCVSNRVSEIEGQGPSLTHVTEHIATGIANRHGWFEHHQDSSSLPLGSDCDNNVNYFSRDDK